MDFGSIFWNFPIQLEPQHVYEIQLPILPIRDGCITVKISAQTMLYQDTEELEICIKVIRTIRVFIDQFSHLSIGFRCVLI